MANFDDGDGVWRTIQGRRVFIREGQSLGDAMKASGKFKNLKGKGGKVQSKKELLKERLKDITADKEKTLSRTEKNKELYEKIDKETSEENKYKATKREGFGSYNDDNIPVYDNKIDYTGDFSRADLSKLSDEELTTALNKQSELYNQAAGEKLGDQRTRNGRMDKIFNTAKKQKYEQGMTKLNEEMQKRNMPRYNIYDDKNNTLLVSSPTKEMAERQLKEMAETDKSLQKEYGWKELPKYSMKEEKMTPEQVNDKMNPKTGKPIHKLGQLNETDETVDIGKYKTSNYFEKHEKERLEIAKDIAKELNPSLKNASDTLLEKRAKELLEPPDGYQPEKGETLYTNQKGGLEYSTTSLKEWRDRLTKTSEKSDNETFIQNTNMYGGTREYNKEELDRMKENGMKPMKNSYTGGGWEGTKYDSKLSTKEIAKNITDYSKKEFPDVKLSRKTDYNGVDLYVTSSDKDLYIDDKYIDSLSNKQLVDLTNNYGNQMFFDRWAKDNVPSYTKEHSFTADDVRRYMKEDVARARQHEMNVSGNEYFLSDYGKKVISGLNKEMNSYNYDDSDGMVDYFNTNFYGYVHIGKWDKPYEAKQTTSTSQYMNNQLRQKAFQKYMKEHPASKMSFEDFKKMESK